MAISTYSELQTAVANYLDRGDLTARIPEFISLAENKLNRKLRLREMRQLATATYSSGSRFLALPSGFLEMLNLVMKPATSSDESYITPIYVGPEQIVQYYSTSGTPQYYTLRDQLEFNCEAGSNHTVRLLYLKKWDIATDSTNWLLTNNEDAYLYGTLMEAEPYLKNDERVIMWKAMFNEAMEELNALDERSQDDAILGTDVYLLNSNRTTYNVVTDDY